jgi:Ca2+-binding EF-hand superfamily protein
VALKKFPPMPSIVRDIIYSPDKTVIALGGSSDICIFDELPNDPDDANFFLRSTKAGDNDIIAISYSHRQGLIAVADCLGEVLIFDYEFVSLEGIIDDVVGSEIGRIEFLDPLPLLVVTDNFGNYTLLSVKKDSLNVESKKQMWRLETQVGPPLGKTSWGRNKNEIIKVNEVIHIPNIAHIRSELERSESENRRKQELGFTVSSVNTTPRIVPDSTITGESHGTGGFEENGLDGLDEITSTNYEANELNVQDLLEEIEEENSAPKPFSIRKMNKYLLTKRNVTSIKIQCISEIYEPEKKIGTAESALKMKKSMEKSIRKAQKESFEVDSDDSDDERNRLDDEKEFNNNNADPDFPSLGFNMYVICGYDDGTISIVDLTLALMDINIGISNYVANKRPNYDPRKKMVKSIGYGDLKRGAWTSENTIEKFTNCRLFKVWAAAGHTPVTTVDIVGDDLNIISAANDSSIILWDRDGVELGAITKGKEFDKLFKPHWKSLLNVEKRNILRQKQAVQLMNALHLKIRDSDIIKNIDDETGTVSIKHNHRERLRSIFDTSVDFNTLPDRQRIIGQMNGNITYELSNRDHAQLIVTQKTADFRKKFQNIGNETKKKKKKTAVNPFINNGGTHGNFGLDGKPIKPDKSNEEGYSPYEESRYMNEVLYDSKYLPNYESQSTNEAKQGPETDKKKKTVKTKYDLELGEIDASDPNNWEIFSKNRQRAMYGMLHNELEKMGVTKDKMKVFVHKLNSLSPNYDFVSFANKINVERTKAKEEFRKRQEQRKQAKEAKRIESEEKLKLAQPNEKLRLDLSFNTKLDTVNLGDSTSKESIVINNSSNNVSDRINNSDICYTNSPNSSSNNLTPVKINLSNVSIPSPSLSPKDKDLLQRLNETSNLPVSSPRSSRSNLSSNSQSFVSHSLSPIRTNLTINTSLKNSPVASSGNTSIPTSSSMSNQSSSSNTPVSTSKNSSVSSLNNSPTPTGNNSLFNSAYNSPLQSKLNSPVPTGRSPLPSNRSDGSILPVLVSSKSSKQGSKSNSIQGSRITSKNHSPRFDTDEMSMLTNDNSMITDDNISQDGSVITNMSMLSKSISIGNISYKTNASSSWKGPNSNPRPSNSTRKFLEESINKFETSIATAESNFKISKRKQRKNKKKKKIEEENNSSSSVDLQRHLTANLLLEKCSSIDDISIVDYKQQMVENKINRKVQLALKNDYKLPFRSSSDLNWNFSAHLYLEDRTKSKYCEKAEKINIKSKGPLYSAPSIITSKENQEAIDKKLALKTQFGSYQSKDLLKFYVVWEMLPKFIKECGWDGTLPLRPGVKDPALEVEEIKEEIVKHDLSDSEDEDEIGDEISTFNLDETSNVSSLTGITSTTNSTYAPAVKKEKSSEFSALFSPKDAASLNTACTEIYAIDDKRVLTRLEELLHTTYMKNHTDFTANLEKCMNNRLSTGIDRNKIEICLSDCLKDMCPHMSFREQKDCVRYFDIKTRSDIEKRNRENALKGLKKVQILTEDQIAQMRAMFNFFDKDDSETVSKAEINAALADKNKQEKLASVDRNNMSGGEDVLIVDATDISDSALDDIVGEVDEDDDAELDFDEFVKLFKDELLF